MDMITEYATDMGYDNVEHCYVHETLMRLRFAVDMCDIEFFPEDRAVIVLLGGSIDIGMLTALQASGLAYDYDIAACGHELQIMFNLKESL